MNYNNNFCKSALNSFGEILDGFTEINLIDSDLDINLIDFSLPESPLPTPEPPSTFRDCLHAHRTAQKAQLCPSIFKRTGLPDPTLPPSLLLPPAQVFPSSSVLPTTFAFPKTLDEVTQDVFHELGMWCEDGVVPDFPTENPFESSPPSDLKALKDEVASLGMLPRTNARKALRESAVVSFNGSLKREREIFQHVGLQVIPTTQPKKKSKPSGPSHKAPPNLELIPHPAEHAIFKSVIPTKKSKALSIKWALERRDLAQSPTPL
jgi:hypothetical protein